MKKIQSFLILIVFTCFSFSQVFFSEYAEGSSNNKYLEIYNATDDDVDLSEYSLSSCSNGCNETGVWDYPDNVTFEVGTTVAAGDAVAATIACHRSVRAGDTLDIKEMEELIRALETANNPQTCPHGRPTMLQIHSNDIEKEFGRKY